MLPLLCSLNLSFFGVVSSWPTGLIHGCRSFHVENMTNLQAQGWRLNDTSRTLEETFDSLIFDQVDIILYFSAAWDLWPNAKETTEVWCVPLDATP
jgi:hypothetical protein